MHVSSDVEHFTYVVPKIAIVQRFDHEDHHQVQNYCNLLDYST